MATADAPQTVTVPISVRPMIDERDRARLAALTDVVQQVWQALAQLQQALEAYR